MNSLSNGFTESALQKRILAALFVAKGKAESVIRELYEDVVHEKIPRERYDVLAPDCDKKLAEIKMQIAKLQKEAAPAIDSLEGVKSFMTYAKKYKDSKTLTAASLRELTEKIVIHERQDGVDYSDPLDGRRVCIA